MSEQKKTEVSKETVETNKATEIRLITCLIIRYSSTYLEESFLLKIRNEP